MMDSQRQTKPELFRAYLNESEDATTGFYVVGGFIGDSSAWQRLKLMEKLADMLLNHLEGILNYCRTKVKLGVVEAVNSNFKALLRRGRGYLNLNYLLLKAQRLAATRTEFVAFKKAA
jgi:hypothetical protein